MSTTGHPLLEVLFPQQPFYAVLQSDDPPAGTAAAVGAWGTAGKTLDIRLKDWLESRGLWRGRRPAIYVADLDIRTFAEKNTPAGITADQYETQIVRSVTTHEAAHVAQIGIDLREPTPELTAYAERMEAYSIVANADDSPLPAMMLHDDQFIRLSLHAAYRASQAGFSFPIDYLFDWQTYEVAPPSEFENRLMGEPEALADVSLPEIINFRPPIHFTQLWQECVQAWIEKHPPQTVPDAGRGKVKTLLHSLQQEKVSP